MLNVKLIIVHKNGFKVGVSAFRLRLGDGWLIGTCWNYEELDSERQKEIKYFKINIIFFSRDYSYPAYPELILI